MSIDRATSPDFDWPRKNEASVADCLKSTLAEYNDLRLLGRETEAHTRNSRMGLFKLVPQQVGHPIVASLVIRLYTAFSTVRYCFWCKRRLFPL